MATRKPPPPPALAKRPPHRLAFVPTAEQRLTVRVMVAGGILQDDIARALSISDVTLRKHFRMEINTAAATANASVVASLHAMAIGRKATAAQPGVPAQPAIAPDAHAAKWWTQARMGWSERLVLADGGIDDTNISSLSDSQIEARISQLQRRGRGARSTSRGTA